MGVLDGFKLQYERMDSEGEFNRKSTILRLCRSRARVLCSRIFLALKRELGRDVAPVRLFKRVQHVESQLDKPFLYESELFRRIEQLEDQVHKLGKGKRYGKSTQ